METPDPAEALGWRIRERRIALTAFRWRVEASSRQRLGLDGWHEFHRVRSPDYVHVVALTSRRELVLVRQFRHGIEAETLEFPGGLVDGGEDPIVAAGRELLEETGRMGPIEPLGALHPNPAMQDNLAWYFLCSPAEPVGVQRLEATEDVRVELLPLDEVVAAAGTGALTNAMVVAGLHLLAQSGGPPAGGG